jgi:hypothetical protein
LQTYTIEKNETREVILYDNVISSEAELACTPTVVSNNFSEV